MLHDLPHRMSGVGVNMGSRRQARVYALQILFQRDVHHDAGDWLAEFWAARPVKPELRAFTDQLVDGVLAHRREVDRLIEAAAANWTLARMPIVDRNILRLSVYELIWMSEVPAKVTLNEAIELAKMFADDEGARFVNGILDRILREDPRLEAKRADVKAGPMPRASGQRWP